MLSETPLWPELQPPARTPRRRRGTRVLRRRWTVGIVTATVGLVVVTGSAYTFNLFGPGTHAAHPQPVAADVQAELAGIATLRADLAAEIKDARTVLKSPDGKAAGRPERRTLDAAINGAQELVPLLESASPSLSGTTEEVNAAMERSSTLHETASVASAALRDASAAVIASGRHARLERATTELHAARGALEVAVADGDRAYAGSVEATDVPGRDGLQAELNGAGDLLAQAGGLLKKAEGVEPRSGAGADLLDRAGGLTTAMSEAVTRLEAATAVVLIQTAADEADSGGSESEDSATTASGADAAGEGVIEEEAGTTAPAGTCPELDQVWSAENGHLASSELAAIPFSPTHAVRADVVTGLGELNDAYAAEFGVNMTINSSYRTYAAQESLYDPSSKTAAPPGCSNHGTGLAVDIGGGVQAFGSAQYDWLMANAEAYGWVHPPFAAPSGRNPEPWHWQSVQAPNSY